MMISSFLSRPNMHRDETCEEISKNICRPTTYNYVYRYILNCPANNFWFAKCCEPMFIFHQ